MISEKTYQLSKSAYRRIKLRVDLLSFGFQILASLEGNVLEGNITIDANADIRRVANVKLLVTDSSFEIGEDKKIWLDKYIQIYVGLLDPQDNVEWINMGIYLIDNPTRTYNATTHELSFSAYDLMSKMTGLRNGQLPGVPTLIPAGSSIRGTMASTVSQLGGFNRFIIDDNPQDVPYDIKVETGGYVSDIIFKLRDISANWEVFFDVDGVFHYQPIKAYYNNEIIADDDVFNYVVTEVVDNVDFENVKNVIEVFGKSIDPMRYGGVATLSGSTYSITLEDFTTLTPNLTIGFTTPSNNGTVNNAQLQINSSTALPLLHEDGTPVTISENDEYFVVMNQSKFIVAGSGETATYSATATVNTNIYNLSIPSMTSWTAGTVIAMTVPSMKLVLNNNKTYTISGSNVAIPNSGEIVYIKITGSSTATIVAAQTPTYNVNTVRASGLDYYIAMADITAFRTNDVIRFEAPYIEKSPNIQINNNLACQVYDSNGAEQIELIQAFNTTYKIKIPTTASLLYLGHQQIHAELEERNTASPFYVEKDIGKIRLVCKDGEYNNIYTDRLALERARYELYLHCRMEDTIDLTMVPLYWLDVNQKIYFNEAGINSTYITKNIQMDLSPTGTMKVNAIKFYPDMVAADGTGFIYVKSITSSGTQYIDTGIIPNQNSGFYLDFTPANTIPSGSTTGIPNAHFINAGGASGNNRFCLSTYKETNGGELLVGSYKATNPQLVTNTRAQISVINKVITLPNGNTVSINPTAFTSSNSFLLFACHASPIAQFATMTLYNCKIYNGTTLVRDFAPILTENNVYALYDKINNQIYYNAGTGNFTGE